MTTRESMHRLLDRLSDDEVEALAVLARERRIGKVLAQAPGGPRAFIDGREYPSLVSVWDNDDDAIFDEM